jgi:DNA-directed RNA polymerase subunit RPC12/RpoP
MDAEGWLTSELASFACAACGQPYGESHIRLIAQREELFFVDLSCPHCGSQAVAIVTIQVDGEAVGAGAGVPLELPAFDPESSSEGPAVSVDDVIDAHVLLRDFEGDVHQLIARFDVRRP